MEEVLPSEAAHLRRYPVLSDSSDFEPKHPVETVRFPVSDTPRYPVSKEYMATFVGLGKTPSNQMEGYFLEELHASVSAMVHGLVFKYVSTCQWGESTDMVQDCWVRILEKLHLYKRDRAQFTTWIYHVCSSVLNRYYRKGRKYRERYVEMDETIRDSQVSQVEVSSMEKGSDVRMAIRELLEENQDHRGIILALFGSPDADRLAVDVDCGRAALACGLEKSQVVDFYEDVVRPFFVQRFRKGERDGN
jgi:DNA-directed RNA polymerase specialized sigma24 family protein